MQGDPGLQGSRGLPGRNGEDVSKISGGIGRLEGLKRESENVARANSMITIQYNIFIKRGRHIK